MRILTLDLETTDWAERGDPRWDNPSQFGLAILGIEVNGGPQWWGPPTDMMNMCEDLQATNFPVIQEHLDNADIVITFNGEHFNFAVLEGAGFDITHARAVSYDLMAAFVKVAGHRINLANFAKALGVGEKTGSGENATQLWQAATFLLEQATPHRESPFVHTTRAGAKHLYQSVRDYCLNNVALTRACYDALESREGWVRYEQRTGYREVQLIPPKNSPR